MARSRRTKSHPSRGTPSLHLYRRVAVCASDRAWRVAGADVSERERYVFTNARVKLVRRCLANPVPLAVVADAFQTAIYELTEPDEPEKKSKDKSSKDKDKSKDKSKDKKGGKGKDKGKEKGKSGGGGKTGKVGGGGGKDAGESWGHPNYPDGGPPKIYGGKVEGGGGGGKKKH